MRASLGSVLLTSILASVLGDRAARAELRVDLGDGIVAVDPAITVVDGEPSCAEAGLGPVVQVTRGDVRVTLPLGETHWDFVVCPIIAATASRDALTVRYTWGMQSREASERFPRDTLDAMLSFAEGQRSVALGRLDEAIASLAKAATLLPARADYRVAAVRALSAAGRRAEALDLARAAPAKAQVALLLELASDPALQWLVAEPDLAAWRHPLPPPDAGGVTLPLVDNARGLAVVGPRWQTRALPGDTTPLQLVDLESMRTLGRGRADAWLPILLALGFEPPVDAIVTNEREARFPRTRVGFMCTPTSALLLANGRTVGEVHEGCATWGMGASSPRAEIALFASGALVRNDYYLSCHDPEPSERLTFVPLTKPATEQLQALLAPLAARAALARHEPAAALVALGAVPARTQHDPGLEAWRSLAEALQGEGANVATRVAAMPFPWALLVATHPAAPPALGQAAPLMAQRAAIPGTATALPAFDPVRRVLVWADETRPDTVNFADAKGRLTAVTGFPVTVDFLRAAGFVAPTARVASLGAAEGHWRAVGPTGLRLVCDNDDDLVLSREGKALVTGRRACERMSRPRAVWFFDGAALAVGDVRAELDADLTERAVRGVIVK